ncbi:MAG: DUF6249 domain-containing protein [Bryobacteraceae bacterium]
MDNAIPGIITAFAWTIVLIVIWQLRLRAKERELERRHKERLMAMEHGVPLPELPAEPEKMSTTAEVWTQLQLNPKWPLGAGALCVMLGIGVSLALMYSGEAFDRAHASFGLIGVFLGIGLWLHYFLTRR